MIKSKKLLLEIELFTDYIAGMTDRFAINEHKNYMTLIKVGNGYL